MTRLDFDGIAGRSGTRITDERREAAVLAPVIERDGGHALLVIKRADDLGEHPGQMAFPGGGREPHDDDRRATVVREVNEEIGLLADEIDFVGRLNDIRTVTEYAVSPFVARIPDREYRPDGVEVSEIAVLPIEALLDADNYEYEQRDHPYYGEIVVHYFHVDGYTVWGATGRILVELLERTTAWRAPVRMDDAGGVIER